MRTLALPAILAMVAAACGGGENKTEVDAPPTIDAPPPTPDAPPDPAFDCTVPAAAPATVTVGGKAVQIVGFGIGDSAGTKVEAFKGVDPTPLASNTTNAMGAFSLELTTGGAPLNGFIKATKATYMDTYLYPGTPIAANIPNATTLMLSPADAGTIATFAGSNLPQGTQLVGFLVINCQGNAIAGATVVTEPALPVKYTRANGTPDSAATATATNGLGFAIGATAGNLKLTATVNGRVLPARTFNVLAGTFTTAVLDPKQ